MWFSWVTFSFLDKDHLSHFNWKRATSFICGIVSPAICITFCQQQMSLFTLRWTRGKPTDWGDASAARVWRVMLGWYMPGYSLPLFRLLSAHRSETVLCCASRSISPIQWMPLLLPFCTHNKWFTSVHCRSWEWEDYSFLTKSRIEGRVS